MHLVEPIPLFVVLQHDNPAAVASAHEVVPVRARQTKRGEGANNAKHLRADDRLHLSALVGPEQLEHLVTRHDDLLRLGGAEVAVYRALDAASLLQGEVVQEHGLLLRRPCDAQNTKPAPTLPRADLRRAPRYDQPLGIGPNNQSIHEGFAGGNFSQLRSSQLRVPRRASGKLASLPADGILELSPASRHCGCARTESVWLWATEPNRDASSHRVRGLQGSGQGARMRPRRGFSAMDRPRDRVSGIRVGGRLARRGDCWNGRVEKRVRDRLCGITGTVR